MVQGTEAVERKATVTVRNRRHPHGFALVSDEDVSLKKTPDGVFLKIRPQRGVNRTQYQVGDRLSVTGRNVAGLIKELLREA